MCEGDRVRGERESEGREKEREGGRGMERVRGERPIVLSKGRGDGRKKERK